MTLEELIAQSRATVAAREAQKQAEEAERQRVYDEKFNQVIANAIGRINASLPEPLRPFVVYAGADPDLETLNRYPDNWTPCDFKVASAPGLIDINFTTAAARGSSLRVTAIQIFTALGTAQYGTDWAQAINDAADAFSQAVRR